MPSNVYPSRSAEKVQFRELFRNDVDVIRNGGTLIGSPVVKDGVTLDGATQAITYKGDVFGITVLAIDIEFSPDFEADDGLSHFLLDSNPSLQYTIFKFNNNTLRVIVGGVTLSVPLVTYQSLWNVNGRNRLVVSLTPTSNKIWLNGIEVYNTGVYSPTLGVTDFVIGRRQTAVEYFGGKISRVSISSVEITQADVDQMEAGQLWTYPNRASVWLDFKESTERGGLQQTLDKSRNGHVCLLGDGSTAATIPDFLNPGFDMDGANHYMHLINMSNAYMAAGQTIAVRFRPDFSTGDDDNFYLYDSIGSGRFLCVKTNNASANALRCFMGGIALGNVAEAVYAPYWIQNGTNILVVTGVSGDTDIILNNHLIANSGTTWPSVGISDVYLGVFNTVSAAFFRGEYGGFFSWSEVLSPLQVRDLTLALGVMT